MTRRWPFAGRPLPSFETADVPLFPVVIDSLWGYVNVEGRIKVVPQFDQALAFSEGLAPVRVGTKWGYVDASGAQAIAPRSRRRDRFATVALRSDRLSSALRFATSTRAEMRRDRRRSIWRFRSPRDSPPCASMGCGAL